MARRALIGLLAMPLIAATFGPWEFEDTQNPVEQQTQGGATQPDHSLWVVNNTGCVWDADDSRSMGFLDSTLAAGETVSGSKCYIADWQDRQFYVNAFSKSPDLVVTLEVQPLGFAFTLIPSFDSAVRRYRYEMCFRQADYDRDYPNFQPIPDSGFGGVGVPQTITVSIRNPTNRTVRSTSALFRFSTSPYQGRCDLADLAAWTFLGSWPGPFIGFQVP